MTTKEVSVSEATALAPVSDMDSPLLRLAIDKNLDIDKLKELILLKREEDRRAAEREFHDAMASFQAECPVIAKNREAVDTTKPGGKRLYVYADLAEIARTVRPILARYGLSWTWASEIVDGKMAVTCTVRHRSGHSQSAAFLAVISGTSIMSDSQKAGGAVTFAQRYSLIQALGLTTAEEDTDARDDFHGGGESGATITDTQAANLAAMLDEIGPGEMPRFLKWVGAPTLAEIPARDFKRAVAALDAKRKAPR